MFRISYVGENGWEIYTPTEHGLALWDAVFAAGEPHGIVPVGIGVYAVTGRIEKGYRLMGAELESEYDPVEAGLARPEGEVGRLHRQGGVPGRPGPRAGGHAVHAGDARPP